MLDLTDMVTRPGSLTYEVNYDIDIRVLHNTHSSSVFFPEINVLIPMDQFTDYYR
jgi:hypothetical protein